jgi:hypothetical protein
MKTMKQNILSNSKNVSNGQDAGKSSSQVPEIGILRSWNDHRNHILRQTLRLL